MRKYEIVIQDDKGNTLQTIPAKYKEHNVEVGGIEWREVGAHPKYSVSTDGQVRNNKTGRILKQFLGGTKRAYLCVNLDGKKRGVHTLVAEAFLPREDYQTYVVHKDKNPKNNRVENLMWKKDHYHVHPTKGEWLHIEGDDDTYICPFCKTATYCEGDYVPKFCMECGADMRGEKNDK